MTTFSHRRRYLFVALVLVWGSAAHEGGSRAAVPQTTLVEEIATDIARVEAVLQRHRDPAGSTVAIEVNAQTPGIVRRAEVTLRSAAMLRSRWKVTVDSALLQREFERMRRETARPVWLEELIDALDRDGTRVARALVAPALTVRLALEKFQAEGHAVAEWDALLAREAPAATDAISLARTWRVSLLETTARASLAPGNDAPGPSWRSGGLLVDARDGAGQWTGSSYLLWNGDSVWIYDPATDSWRLGNSVNQPIPTSEPSVQWTGTKLFVWGGVDTSRPTNKLRVGGLYDPIADSWTRIDSAAGHDAYRTRTVWTGALVIGIGESSVQSGTATSCPCVTFGTFGGAFWTYSPATNSWEKEATLPPSPIGLRQDASLVWTGTEMLVWGGSSVGRDQCGPSFPTSFSADGAAYNPSTRSWRVLPASGLQPRASHVSAWTGTEWMIWGGNTDSASLFDGALYKPSTNSWRPVSNSGAPQFPAATALWIGSEVLVRGGGEVNPEAGARYNPATDNWSSIATAPFSTGSHAAWTGSEALYPLGLHGGRYRPATDSWLPIYPVPARTPRRNLSPGVIGFTGTELLVWGGTASPPAPPLGGDRFNLVTASWSPISTVGAPAQRGQANSAWTGTAWLIQGGSNAAGGRYNPATDSWQPMSRVGEPGTSLASTVWTGSEFILWYGTTGAKYRPATDRWVPMRLAGAPRRGSIAWLGSRMMAWAPGSQCPPPPLAPAIDAQGALYDPIADLWAPITTQLDLYGDDQLVAVGHGAVKLDGVRLLYGGPIFCGDELKNTAATPYDPSSNSWNASIGGYYEARRAVHTWDGSGIIRENGWFTERDNTPAACSREIAVKQRARIDLASQSVQPLALSSPLSWSKDLVVFWTGQEALHFDPVTALGVFYDPGFDPTTDADGDGFRRGVDCDDAEATTHPGATEICDFRDNNCNGSVDEGVDIDRDNDGLGACSNDCDDFAATTHPGAPELCDRIDNNCNGNIDDGAGLDNDGDGHSNCNDDCNDNNNAVYPGAPELCDNLDNDCDGSVDEGAGVDNDNDGHMSCIDDCNDNNNAVYPGAPELCDNLDNDCDGSVDEGAGVDNDGDGHRSCVDDCNDNNNTIYPGALELCDGLDNDCDSSVDEGIGVDNDNDGHSSCNDDCNDNSSSVWKKPGNFSSLKVQGKPNSVVSWGDMKPSWGTSSVYDVVRGRMSQLLATHAYSQAFCLANNRATNSITDSVSVPGDAFYYFVRGQNSCGTGTYGTTTRDTTTTACP